MENGNIADFQITSSSNYSHHLTATKGRLNGAQSWAARRNDDNQWIQVYLGKLKIITSIDTQGRSDYDQWVTKYVVSYSLDGHIFNQYQEHKADKVRKRSVNCTGLQAALILSEV